MKAVEVIIGVVLIGVGGWLLFAAFVGANLLQSSLTDWCLMEDLLRKLGVRDQYAKRET